MATDKNKTRGPIQKFLALSLVAFLTLSLFPPEIPEEIQNLAKNSEQIPEIDLSPEAEAKFTQDNNNGFFDVDFKGNETGLEPNEAGKRDNVTINTQAGYATLELTDNPGYLLSSTITPSSFSQWDQVIIEGIYNQASDLSVSLYDCSDTPGAIAGFQNLPLVGGSVDISSLNKTTYPCLRARVDLNPNATVTPVVENLTVTWEPLPVFLLGHSSLSPIRVGQDAVFTINLARIPLT